jgi:hypothetical protein
MMAKEIQVLTPEEKKWRTELEEYLLSCPGVEFAGINGDPSESGKVIITLGSQRTGLVKDLLPGFLGDLMKKQPNLSFSIALIRGRTSPKTTDS